MIKVIIHAADIHIRPYQRLEEYSEQFGKFMEKCKEIAEKYEYDEVRILISGDIVHSKLTVTNELMVFTSLFLRQLQEIAPVVIIAGNHDTIVGNNSRTDTLTGVFNTANFEHCSYLDEQLGYKSGCVIDDNVVWAVYSIFDDYAIPDMNGMRENENTRIIGLYHGNIVGATLQNGTVMDTGLEGDTFEGCDCIMAGHIHKRQVIKRGDVEIVFPGSLIQQSFGETITQHGFAVWNLENMTYEFVDIESDYSLIDLEIDKFEDVDENKERLINF